MSTAIDTTYEPSAHYHRDYSRVSRSHLKVLQKSRRKYHATFVEQTIEPDPPDSKLLVGTASHTLLLEPDRIESEIVVIPPSALTKRKDGGEGAKSGGAWDEFQAAHVGKVLLKPSEFDLVRRMVDAVLNNARARSIVELSGRVEHTVSWECPVTGIACKCRPDKLISLPLVIDLKTAADPSPQAFARMAANLLYDQQAAWYRFGVEMIYAVAPDFVFIVVGKEPPHLVRVYDFEPEDLEAAHERNMESLALLKHCRTTGDWSDPEEHDVVTLKLPRYGRPNQWSLEA